MKKLFSILLLAVFTFNLGGYYVVFKWLQITAHHDLIQKLETNQYDESETIELKLAITLPYANQLSSGFKRVDGRFEYKGNIYKLVKQKFEQDTLYIVCIKDQKEKQLINKFKEYAKNTHDTPSSSSKKDTGNTLKQINKDYYGDSGILLADILATSFLNKFSYYQFHQSSFEVDVPTPPPQA
jgi:hypothetical protein